MAGRSGRNVTYAVQKEPAFIKRFKEKIGYKEDPGIDEKRQKPESADLSDEEDTDEVDCAEDEKPVVVVLRPGDLTAEEAEQHAATEGQQEPGAESYGRIVFRKPSIKRSSDGNNAVLSASSASKKARTEKDNSRSPDSSVETKTQQRSDRTADKVKPNSSLLSFSDDDDDDDDS